MADTAIIVINGAPVLDNLNSEYAWKHEQWINECASVRARFHKKTSRSQKGDKIYEYTNWYQETGSGLKCIGKEEPDYSKYYSPEPKPAISFQSPGYGEHIVLSQKDYEANQKLFNDCLVFKLEGCLNYIHPLYRNLEKALKDSVREHGVSSERSPRGAGQKDDLCFNEGDCDNCEHNDECPVSAEEE